MSTLVATFGRATAVAAAAVLLAILTPVILGEVVSAWLCRRII